MNRRRIIAVTIKDWKELRHNPQAVIPVLVLPFLLAGILPAILIVVGGSSAATDSVNGMGTFIRNLPESAIPARYDQNQGIVYALLVYFLAPVFLLIPTVASMVVASLSFAGERERRTLEGLLYSPLTARELVLAKIVVSFLPSLMLTWFAFALYSLVVNTVGNELFGGSILPTRSWIVVALLLAPAVAFLVVGLIVAVSLHTKTVQAAQSTAACMVLPLIGLVVAQATGAALLEVRLALVLSAVVIVLDAILVSILVARFDREALVLRL